MAFTPNEYTQTIWDRLTQVFTEEGTAGLMGNLWAESGCTPYACQPSRPKNICLIYIDKVDSGTITEYQFVHGGCSSTGNYISTQLGFGLAQWTFTSRKQNLYDYMYSNGNTLNDINNQLDFLIEEMQASYPSVYSFLQSTTSVDDASDMVLEDYENPDDQSEAVHTLRQGYSQSVYDEYSSSGADYRIILSVSGNGTATVSPTRVNVGDTYTLTCTPATGETLEDIVATEVATGMSVAIAVQTGSQTITMRSESNISIVVTFSGETPVPPTPPTRREKQHGMPIWLYPTLRRF